MAASAAPTIAVARPRGTYLGVAALGLGPAGVTVALVVTRAAREGLSPLSCLVLACAAVLLLCVVSLLCGLASRGPSLTVSDAGIADHTSLFGVGLLRWAEIAGLATFRFYAQRYLLILLRDPDAVAARLGPLPRAVVKVNAVLSPAPICIPAALLPGMEAMLAQIEKQYADRLAAHGIWVRRSE